MTFQLYIMRHAKSDRDVPGLADFDRPLNNRGEKNSVRIGLWMEQNKRLPEKIISSSAVRAKQTIELVVNQTSSINPENIIYEKDLYLADLDTLIELIQLYKNDVNSLMLIAHNPGLERLVRFLSSESDSYYRNMTTANLAIFEYPDNQFEPAIDKGKLIEFIKPKDLD